MHYDEKNIILRAPFHGLDTSLPDQYRVVCPHSRILDLFSVSSRTILAGFPAATTFGGMICLSFTTHPSATMAHSPQFQPKY